MLTQSLGLIALDETWIFNEGVEGPLFQTSSSQLVGYKSFVSYFWSWPSLEIHERFIITYSFEFWWHIYSDACPNKKLRRVIFVYSSKCDFLDILFQKSLQSLHIRCSNWFTLLQPFSFLSGVQWQFNQDNLSDCIDCFVCNSWICYLGDPEKRIKPAINFNRESVTLRRLMILY